MSQKISLFTLTIHLNLRWAERGVWLNVSLIALIPSSFLVFNYLAVQVSLHEDGTWLDWLSDNAKKARQDALNPHLPCA